MERAPQNPGSINQYFEVNSLPDNPESLSKYSEDLYEWKLFLAQQKGVAVEDLHSGKVTE